jgi:hypothetical protein
MEYSKNFEFALPSSNNDIDLADINEIANNFRKIDENAVKKEEGKGLSTNDFTDAYKEKLEKTGDTSGGFTAITEEVNAGDLDYGIYYIDGNNGGSLNVPDDNYFASGTIFVSPDADFGLKQVSILGIEPNLQTPIIVSYFYDEDGNFADIYDEFVSKTYVDASVNILQKQIDELKNTPTIRTEIELNNKGDIVYSWYRDATTGGNVTKTNDGWSIVGYSKSASSGVAYTHFALVGKTQESAAFSGSGNASGTLTYNGIVYYYTVKKIATQYVTDYGKAEQLEETFTDNTTLATKVLDYYFGVA